MRVPSTVTPFDSIVTASVTPFYSGFALFFTPVFAPFFSGVRGGACEGLIFTLKVMDFTLQTMSFVLKTTNILCEAGDGRPLHAQQQDGRDHGGRCEHAEG